MKSESHIGTLNNCVFGHVICILARVNKYKANCDFQSRLRWLNTQIKFRWFKYFFELFKRDKVYLRLKRLYILCIYFHHCNQVRKYIITGVLIFFKHHFTRRKYFTYRIVDVLTYSESKNTNINNLSRNFFIIIVSYVYKRRFILIYTKECYYFIRPNLQYYALFIK